MLNKLFNMIKDARKGMCIQVEYYHVVDCVIRIWKSPAYIELGERPLIEIQDSIDIAPLKAILMLSEIKTLSLDILNDKKESIYDY